MSRPVYKDLVRLNVDQLRRDNSWFRQLLGHEALGDVAIVGGALRDWSRSQRPRDIDVIVSTTNVGLRKVVRELEIPVVRKTTFGGFKLDLAGQEADVWSHPGSPYAKGCTDLLTYPGTVFFDIDALMYDYRRDQLHADVAMEALAKKKLGVVNPSNGFMHLQVGKSMVALLKYGLSYADSLKNLFVHEVFQGLRLRYSDVELAQVKHYGQVMVLRPNAEKLLDFMPKEFWADD